MQQRANEPSVVCYKAPRLADADGIRQRAYDQLYIRCTGPGDGSEVSV